MQSRMRVPDAWISSCSGEKSRKIVSTTRSTPLSASIAGRFPASGVAPTAHTPSSPSSVDRRLLSRTW